MDLHVAAFGMGKRNGTEKANCKSVGATVKRFHTLLPNRIGICGRWFHFILIVYTLYCVDEIHCETRIDNASVVLVHSLLRDEVGTRIKTVALAYN